MRGCLLLLLLPAAARAGTKARPVVLPVSPVPGFVALAPVRPVASALLPPLSLALPRPAASAAPSVARVAEPARPGLMARLGNWLARPRPQPSASVEHSAALESLHELHGLMGEGDWQRALDRLEDLFVGRRARGWYDRHPEFGEYWQQGAAYYRAAERRLAATYRAGVSRAKDAALVAEVQAAPVAGRAWCPTELQAKDSPYCAFHALANAAASAGRPVAVPELVARAREALDRDYVPLSPERAARLERELGVRLRVRTGNGLATADLRELAPLIGAKVEKRPFPDEPELLVSLSAGARWLLSFRFFHERHAVPEADRRLAGHDLEPLAHEVYLLGSLETSAGRLYLVQDSGVGLTTLYTYAELRALTQEAKLVAF